MKILVAEDDPISLGLLEQSLNKWDYEVEAFSDGAAALIRLLKDDSPQIAILDWMMPNLDGLEVCRALRKKQNKEMGYTYIIILTIKSSVLDMVEGLGAGADDYIMKPFFPQDLKVRLEAGKRIIELQQKLSENKKAISTQLTHDLPTRALNKDTILESILAELNRSKRKNRSLSVALLKIDNYDALYAILGTSALEEILCTTVSRIRDAIRTYDSIGRFSTDEFLILFPETTSIDMQGITARMLLSINEIKTFPETKGISITIGVATCQGRTGLEQLVTTADQALRDALLSNVDKTRFSEILDSEDVPVNSEPITG